MAKARLTRDQYAAISKRSDLNQEILKECLDYQSSTGVFTWKHRPVEHFRSDHAYKSTNSKCEGREAGKVEDKSISLFGLRFRIADLAWMYEYGHLPNEAVQIRWPGGRRLASLCRRHQCDGCQERDQVYAHRL